MKSLVAILILLIFLPFTSQAARDGGGWSSNGGDAIGDLNNPWFLGKGRVHYCIEADVSYPVNESRLKILIDDAVIKWRQFFKQYGLSNYVFGFNNGYFFPDRLPRGINLNFEYVSSCNQSITNQIQFKFGVKNKTIDDNLNARSYRSKSIALRKSYNHNTYTNGGYIWIDDIGSDPRRLSHLILHELGHVLGMKHDSVYVMDKNVVDQILEIKASQLTNLGKIESPSWTYDVGRQKEPLKFLENQSVKDIFIPSSIKSYFKLRNDDKVSLSLKYIRYSKFAKVHYFFMTLKSTGTTSHSHQVSLNLKNDNLIKHKNLNLGLYTYWENSERIRVVKEVLLEPNAFPRSFKGYATIGIDRYAATLIFNKGWKLSIFSRHENTWWELF